MDDALMKPSLWTRLDQAWRSLLPTVVTVALLFLTVIPTHIPYFNAVTPLLPMVAIFYWAIHRPALMPGLLVLALGAFHDLLAGWPLGVSGLAYLMVRGVAGSQRRFLVGKAFGLSWWAFAVLAAVASLVLWAGVSVMRGSPVAFQPMTFQYLTTVAVYPLLALVLGWINLTFLRQA